MTKSEYKVLYRHRTCPFVPTKDVPFEEMPDVVEGTVSKFFCSHHSHMVPIFFSRFSFEIFLCVFSRREKWISYSIMDMSLISG